MPKKKDLNDLAEKIDAITIQTKLKKLIGANRAANDQILIEKQNPVSLQRESANQNDSAKKDRRERSILNKKNSTRSSPSKAEHKHRFYD